MQKNLIAVLIAVSLAAGCSSKSSGGSSAITPPNMGQVAVEITDAPFPYVEVEDVTLQVSQIRFRGRDNDLEKVVTPTVNEVEVMRLRNGRTAELADGLVDTGTYTAILLTIQNVTVKFKDGHQLSLGQASTWDLPLEPNLVVSSGERQRVLVDIDLARSFTFTGPEGNRTFTFAPVGRAVVRGAQSGQILGVFKDEGGLPVADAEVQLGSSGAQIASTKTAADGAFAFIEIQPGTYSVTGFTQDGISVVSSSVSVSQGTTSLQLTAPGVLTGPR